MRINRRDLLVAASFGVAGFLVPRGFTVSGERRPASTVGQITPEMALKQLLEGNERYLKQRTHGPRRGRDRMVEISKAQTPFAAIVGCSDSRVVPEVLFDQGLGDLFVVRIAGNAIVGGGAAVKGSLEYAVEYLHVPLILVLGHENCGAVAAAIQASSQRKSTSAEHIETLVASLQPAITAARQRPQGSLMENAVAENVLHGVRAATELSPSILQRTQQGTLLIKGATYDLDEGHIHVL